MRFRRTLPFCTIAFAAGALSPAAHAQGRHAVGLFVAKDEALPGGPVVLGGGSLTSYVGPLGVRLSGGMHTTWTSEYSSTGNVHRLGLGAWTADADLVFSPFRTSGTLTAMLGGFQPFAFVGIGGHGVKLRERPDTSFATWSYGGGVDRTIVGGLGLQVDARYRLGMHQEPDVLVPSYRSHAWEYRAGITINFGGGPRRSRRPSYGHTTRRPPTRVPPVSHPPRPSDEDVGSTSRAGAARRVLDGAARYVGTPYRYGGASTDGFDCSGFVQYVYAREGVSLPRTSREMATAGVYVEARVSALRPGDLVLFAQDGRHVDHVAIYAGDERIIHSTASGGGVRYDDLTTARGRWFVDHMVAARRVAGVSAGRGYAPPAARLRDTEFDPPDRAPAPRAP